MVYLIDVIDYIAVVQIIQIPPVFTQNVLVGKCVNQNQDTAGSPNEYFVCRQVNKCYTS